MTNQIHNYKIAVVIPYYNADNHIVSVINKLPDFISRIYLIDDYSTQPLNLDNFEKINNTEKIRLITNTKNLGVGGASKAGFLMAIEDKMDFVVKVDADDQMDSSYIKDLINPLIQNQAEYAKGNRFRK